MTKEANILVVDDDPDIREVLRLVLEGAGYTVRAAIDGKDALQRIDEQLPDFMILDVMMNTDTEGFDLMYTLRERADTAEIPVILFTSFLGKVRSSGPEAFDYIMGERWPASWIFEKPLNKEKLLHKIDAILNEK